MLIAVTVKTVQQVFLLFTLDYSVYVYVLCAMMMYDLHQREKVTNRRTHSHYYNQGPSIALPSSLEIDHLFHLEWTFS